jgi:hypothetical protein
MSSAVCATADIIEAPAETPALPFAALNPVQRKSKQTR